MKPDNKTRPYQRSTRGQITHVVDLATGAQLDDAVMRERLDWLANIIENLTRKAVKNAWSRPRLEALAAPGLPSWGYKAYQQALGKPSRWPQSPHRPSRVEYMALELAMRALRGANHQRRIIESMLTGSDLPPFTSSMEARNHRRSIVNFIKEHGCQPRSFLQLRPSPPRTPQNLIPLGPVNKQFAHWVDPTDDDLVLAIKLPTRAKPRSATDWQWHHLHIPITERMRFQLERGGFVRSPSIRGLQVDVPFQLPAVPIPKQARVVLAADWGERRLLTATDVWQAEDGIRSSGQPVFFKSSFAQVKLAAKRAQAGRLRSKIDRLSLLESQVVKVEDLNLACKQVWASYSACSRELARAAARWLIEQAKALGADTIAIEDLRSLESRDRGPKLNARINHQIRSLVFDRVIDIAREEGIRIEVVNARGTSSQCPRCHRASRHYTDSTRRRKGHAWLRCRCGASMDRDHAAAERIGARALSDTPVRRSKRPVLTTKNSRSLRTGTGARRRKPGSTVRPGGAQRGRSSLNGWNRKQRPYHASRHVHRPLAGMRHGLTDHATLTLTKRERSHVRQHPPRHKNTSET